ncbi:hypothetical protein [Catellatospora citrea]|uniref:ATP-grasp domain-containing protein n=1 Tax=Catellatospora citrea TaxID=53366 RepID=A0A8J3KI39_9ACTN|nr:hypothetical protein [Catellatospora citrea]RKE10708.1 biotin carboxylase [Catellatospora citrea]GIG01160.1 hypothetical protein Cci01nite_62530 [Catellatospora citrea]
MTAVLLVGWRPKAIAALRRLGAEVTCAHRPGEDDAATSEQRPHRSVRIADATNAESVLSGLARHDLSLADFDVVCSQQEFTMVTAALIGRDRAWMPLPTAIGLRDKEVQKRRIRQAGLRVADCWLVDDIRSMKVPAYPSVLKPLSGAGARDTVVLGSPAAADDARERLLGARRRGPWLLERFVPGHEHAIDGVVRDGRLHRLSISRYQSNLIRMQDGAHMLYVAQDPAEHPELYRQGRELAESAMRALGHTDGVFHMEAFRDTDGFVFSECGGRVCGGMADVMAELKFGIDLHDEWARGVLRLPAGPQRPVQSRNFAHGWLPLPAGRLVSAPSRAQIEARPGVREANVWLARGDRVVDPRSSSGAGLGTVLVEGDTAAEVEQNFGALVTWIQQNSKIDREEPTGSAVHTR